MSPRRLLPLVLLLGLALPLTAQDAKPEPPSKPEVQEDPSPAEKPEAAPKPEPKKEPKEEPKAETKPEKKKPAPPKEKPKPAPKPAPMNPNDDGFAEIERFTRALELIRAAYVDEGKTNYSNLIDSAIDGMLTGLDPHCQFMAPSLYRDMKKSQTNTYDGVGIGVGMKNNALTIVTVREDGPAAEAGLLPGDQIIRIGELYTENVGALEAMPLLRGKPGEELELTIRRPNTGDFLTATMTRGVLRESTVRDPLLLPTIAGNHRIGYIRLTQFNEPSAFELERELEKLEKDGMEALVLDLRNNPGGLLHIAVKILGLFLPPETTVVTTRGRLQEHTPPPLRTPEKQLRQRTYPVVVLVNHGSASASELVSAALQDLRRAVIVGTTTFGKGSVQSVIPTGNGSAIRMTTAKYYTPGERTIHEHGVEPDIVATTTPEKEAELFRWWRERNRGSDLAGGLVRLRDPQLQRAADTLKALLSYLPTLPKEKAKEEPKSEPEEKKPEPEEKPDPEKAPEAEEETAPEEQPDADGQPADADKAD